MFDADYQHQWLDSVRPEDPVCRTASSTVRHRPAALRAERAVFPRRRDAGYNSLMGHDPTNRVTLVVRTNLTLSPDAKPTANSIC